MSFQVGQVIKRGNKKFLITKVNKKSITLRHFWDIAVKGTNRRQIILGDVYKADIEGGAQ